MDAFGHDLLAWTDASSHNTVVSPLSIAMAFSMARVGARGGTATELDRVFHFPRAMRDQAFNTLTRGLVTTGPSTGAGSDAPPPPPVVVTANALWVRQQTPVGQRFLDTLAEEYGGGVRTVNFRSPKALDMINEWVRQQTAHRIRRVLTQ